MGGALWGEGAFRCSLPRLGLPLRVCPRCRQNGRSSPAQFFFPGLGLSAGLGAGSGSGFSVGLGSVRGLSVGSGFGLGLGGSPPRRRNPFAFRLLARSWKTYAPADP